MLRFFERRGRPMIVLLVLTIVVTINLCIYFFVHQPRFRAHEAASSGESPAQAAAAGEPAGGERAAALSPFVVSPEAQPSTTEAAPSEAEADTEATRGATNASTTGEENAGSPRRAPVDARQANAASLTEMTGGTLSAASTAAPAPSASAAQYGSAAAVQYAASDTSPGDEAAENPMPEFPPPGMPPWMRRFLTD